MTFRPQCSVRNSFLIPSHSDCMMVLCAHGSSENSASNMRPHGWKAKAGRRSTAIGTAGMANSTSSHATMPGIIVFVEVKTRRTLRYGTPQEAVTSSKQINLRHAAVQWLSDSDHRTPHNGVRFDVITVIVRGGKPLMHHIEGAF